MGTESLHEKRGCFSKMSIYCSSFLPKFPLRNRNDESSIRSIRNTRTSGSRDFRFPWKDRKAELDMVNSYSSSSKPLEGSLRVERVVLEVAAVRRISNVVHSISQVLSRFSHFLTPVFLLCFSHIRKVGIQISIFFLVFVHVVTRVYLSLT
jgi:hypothetical protein